MIKKTAKRLTGALLAFTIIFVSFFFDASLIAKAATAGNYYVEIIYYITNKGGCNSAKYTGRSSVNLSKNDNNCAGISLFYKTNNGFGTEGEVYWCISRSAKDTYGQASGTGATVYANPAHIDNATGTAYTLSAIIPGFPTEVFGFNDYDNAFTDSAFKITSITVYNDSDRTQYKKLWDGTGYLNSSKNRKYIYITKDNSGRTGNDSKNGYVSTTSGWENTWTNSYPYIA